MPFAPDYGLIESVAQLRRHADLILEGISRGLPFGFDIETGYEGEERERAQLHPEEGLVAGLSLGFYDPGNRVVWGRYLAVAHDTGPNLDSVLVAEIIWELLRTGYGIPHNALFELRFLHEFFMEHLADHPVWGAEVRACNAVFAVFSDTMLEAAVEARHRSSAHRSSEDGIGSEAALKPLTMDTFSHEMMDLDRLFMICSETDKPLTKKQKNCMRFNILDLTGKYRQKIIDYACEDSVWALAHHYERHARLMQDPRSARIFQIEMAIIAVVADMERTGIVFDWQGMREAAVRAADFTELLNEEILHDLTVMRNEAGIEGACQINLGSPPQLARVLFEDLGMPVKHRSAKTGNPSTDKVAVKELSLSFPVVKKIQTYRGLRKLIGTWLDVWPAAFSYAPDGRAHPHYMQLGVAAGRFAATDPAIMTAPKEYHLELATGQRFDMNFRDFVVCPPGWYGLGYDYSQIELRVLAGEAGETELAAAFARGDDVHSLTASRMLKIPLEVVETPEGRKQYRPTGKTLNFAIGYQMGVEGLADRLGISKDEAQDLFDAYFAGYPGIKGYMERLVSQARQEMCVWTRFGRKVPIWEYLESARYMQAHGDRLAGNAPIQGGAADYMKISMVRARKALEQAGMADRVRLWLNMHDALEFYVHESLSPLEVIQVLQPAVVWTNPLIAHWPPMVAEWHTWQRWGSPVELELDFAPDGLTVIGVRGEEPAPEAPAPAAWTDGEETGPELEMPALSLVAAPAVVPEIQAGGGCLIVEADVMPPSDSIQRLISLLQGRPGAGSVWLSVPEGQVQLSAGCAITSAMRPEILLVLGGQVVIRYEPLAPAGVPA